MQSIRDRFLSAPSTRRKGSLAPGAVGKGHGCDCRGQRLQGKEHWPSREGNSLPAEPVPPLPQTQWPAQLRLSSSVGRSGWCDHEENCRCALQIPLSDAKERVSKNQKSWASTPPEGWSE